MSTWAWIGIGIAWWLLGAGSATWCCLHCTRQMTIPDLVAIMMAGVLGPITVVPIIILILLCNETVIFKLKEK
jgi:hypothetical protein